MTAETLSCTSTLEHWTEGLASLPAAAQVRSEPAAEWLCDAAVEHQP